MLPGLPKQRIAFVNLAALCEDQTEVLVSRRWSKQSFGCDRDFDYCALRCFRASRFLGILGSLTGLAFS